jgi:pimeloyl-ACP methyl ester carboxylesterase/predicted glycosyltransferase
MTRARTPDCEGFVERDGVKLFYEVHGEGDPTIVLLPTWSIIHSRHWKMQVPYLARACRVVTFDGRGNGRSDRPDGPEAYSAGEFMQDTLAVMDHVGVERAVLVSLSAGAIWHLLIGVTKPERVLGSVFIAPTLRFGESHLERAVYAFDDELEVDEGWAKYNRHYWKRDYEDFVEFFFSKMFTEPHSTKQREDCVEWSLETTPQVLIDTVDGLKTRNEPAALSETLRGLCRQLSSPTLVLHGDEDAITPHRWGATLAEEAGGTLVTLEGSGHAPHVRDPVRVNVLIDEFVESLQPSRPPATRWTRGMSRRKRALYISSPIGLGHAQRDVAIAGELKKLHPDLEIDWLAQHPVTKVLEANGERVHPASAFLSNESTHIECESAEHDLHCFQAWRRMDEILLANYMVFHDVVRKDDYDLWIGDEAWELDYYLHENPEEKRAAYCWLTDFVGWLPMDDGGAREASLTADYNAEMIEHIARYPRLRDRAIFVGDPDDIVSQRFGPELPAIRDWTEQHYAFAGYVTGFDPHELGAREALRAELGFGPDECVCIVAVGGSGVGAHLLRRVIDAFPAATQRVPSLRMIAVAGPRIDPTTLPTMDGLEVRAFVPHLYRHLAACDIAVVQGGLTTSMELTANRRPFLYFPLGHHFEQNFHVRHRLERYGAGRCMDFATATPDAIADAICSELARPVDYRPVATDGAARAAQLIAELL